MGDVGGWALEGYRWGRRGGWRNGVKIGSYGSQTCVVQGLLLRNLGGGGHDPLLLLTFVEVDGWLGRWVDGWVEVGWYGGD